MSQRPAAMFRTPPSQRTAVDAGVRSTATNGLVDSTSPTPLVSIGLPVFNGEQYVRHAIASMLAQDVVDLELIISDNGSTDATERICREIAERDPRVRYVRSTTNRGAAWNYNRVFELARGTYFKWAAHDDVCHPSFVSSCIERLSEFADASLCYSNTARIDDVGNEFRRDEPTSVACELTAQERIRSLLMNPTPCFEVFGVMRREQLADTGLIGPYTGSDTVLLVELALRGRFVRVDDYMFFNREHEDRSIRRFRDARLRNAWFDPARRGALAAPRWRLLREYTHVILRSDLGRQAPLHALTTLARWALRNRHRLAREAGSVVRTAMIVRAGAGRGERRSHPRADGTGA